MDQYTRVEFNIGLSPGRKGNDDEIISVVDPETKRCWVMKYEEIAELVYRLCMNEEKRRKGPKFRGWKMPLDYINQYVTSRMGNTEKDTKENNVN